MTGLVIAVILGVFAVVVAVRLYVLYQRAERASAMLDALIEANKATLRPGMERRDERFEIVRRREAR